MKKFRHNLFTHILPITILLVMMAFAMAFINLRF